MIFRGMVLAAAFAVLPAVVLAQDTSQNHQSNQPTIYSVDGLAVGGRVRFESSVYQQYRCYRSSQFSGSTWCLRQTTESGPRGTFSATTSVLHDPDGTVSFVDRLIQPAYFAGSDIQNQLDILSRRYGAPRIQRIDANRGAPAGIIAVFGAIQLEPLSARQISDLSAGRRAQGVIPIDLIGDLERSAQNGLPLFKLSGDAGYIWSASFDASGQGHLRFLAANPSQFAPNSIEPHPQQPPSVQSALNTPNASQDNIPQISGADVERRRASDTDAALRAAAEAEQKRLSEVQAAQKATADAEQKRQAALKAAAESERARLVAEAVKRRLEAEKLEAERLAAQREEERERWMWISIAGATILVAGLGVWSYLRKSHMQIAISAPPNDAAVISADASSYPSDNGAGTDTLEMQTNEGELTPSPSESIVDVKAIIDQLAAAGSLHTSGTIDKDEFERIKTKLLGVSDIETAA